MADLKVKLSGYLPAAEMDGLQPLLQGLVLDPKDRRIVVGVIDVQTRRDHGDGEYEPTVRFLQLEVPTEELRDAAEKVLHAAYSKRTGAMQMFEDDGSNWGVGGQAGQPLVAPTDDTAQGDWTPPAEELDDAVPDELVDDRLETHSGDDDFPDLADDDLQDLAQQEELEGAPAEELEQPAAVQAQEQDVPFQSPEPPQPVKDQVAAKRSRRKQTQSA